MQTSQTQTIGSTSSARYWFGSVTVGVVPLRVNGVRFPRIPAIRLNSVFDPLRTLEYLSRDSGNLPELLVGNILLEGRKMGRKVPSHLVVLGHPSSNSFNAAIAGRYVESIRSTHQDAVLRDLYAIGFDPLLKENERAANGADGASSDVQAELNVLKQCDVLTFVYPLWFGMPPAIITGYIDRVLGAGFRVDDLDRSPEGTLRGKRLAVITTSGSKLTWLEEHGMWISLRQSFDEYLKAVFGFVRCDHYHADSIVDNLNTADAERILFEVGEFARNVCASAAALQQA